MVWCVIHLVLLRNLIITRSSQLAVIEWFWSGVLELSHMVLNPTILLFELTGHRWIIIWVPSGLWLSEALVLVDRQWLSLARSWVPFSLIQSCSSLTLPTAIWLIKNYLMGVMSIVAAAQNLILSLHLLIVWKLSWIVHVDLSSLIKIHVARWVKNWIRSLSRVSISLKIIRHLKSLTFVFPIVPPSWLLCNFDWI